jgi:hypothetical protein
MSIELTTEQAQAVAAQGEAVVVIDPQTKQAYRLVREETFKKVQAHLLYDDSPWTGHGKALLAGISFSKLDDDDYSHYLRETQ